MHKMLRVLTALLFTASLFAQGPSKEGPSALDDLFFKAETFRITGRTEAAIEAYEKLLKKAPEHEAALYQLARLYFVERTPAEALPLARKGAGLYPENEWLLRLYGQGLRFTGDFAGALTNFKALHELRPSSDVYLQEWLQAALAVGDWNEALVAVERLEVLLGSSPELVVQKKDLYLQMNDKKGAQKVLEEAVKLNPAAPEYVGLLAQFYDGNDKRKKALEVLEDGCERFPNYPMLKLEYARVLQEEGDFEGSLMVLKRALVHPDLELDAKADILNSLEEAARVDATMVPVLDEIWEALEVVEAGNVKLQLLKGIRWLIREDYPKALEAYVEAIELGEPDPEIYQQAVALAQEAGEQELGLALLEEMVDVFFLNRGVMRFAAYMYGQWAQWEDCAALAEEAAQMESDPELVIGLYELGANAYFRMDDVFEGSRLYDAALAVDSNASVLNNYAWELAQAEEQLEKALVLTTMSNAKKPLEATFLDTWAWVLYKMNRYAEAQAKIEVALQLSRTSPDPVLFQHAARIAQALGEDGKAAEYRVKASALQGR